MLAFCEGVGGGESDSISWAKPRIALSGVRSSWLMLERKSDFARLAFSAAAFAFVSSAFDLPARGQIARQLCETAQITGLIADRRRRRRSPRTSSHPCAIASLRTS